MTYFQYRINVLDFLDYEYEEFLYRLKFKEDYDIYVTGLEFNGYNLDQLISYAKYIYFRNEEDLLAFKLATGI